MSGKLYAVFEVPVAPVPGARPVSYVEGSAYECAKALLARCTLPELHRLKLHDLLTVQKAVAERTGGECRAKVAAELAGYDLDDRVGLTDSVPPAAGAEVDEDGDEVLEPTPVVSIEPLTPDQVVDRAIDEQTALGGHDELPDWA